MELNHSFTNKKNVEKEHAIGSNIIRALAIVCV